MKQLTSLARVNNKLPLEGAFELFNGVSHNLTAAYQLLEKQVRALSRELARVSTVKASYLSDKEQLTDQVKTLLKSLPCAALVLNKQSIVTRSNLLADEWLGQSLLGSSWLSIQQKQLIQQASQAGEFILDNDRLVSLNKQTLSNGNGFIILLNDISQKRQQKERSEHKNKLEALGQVSASLAHQVRTPLASALLYASQLSSTVVSEKRRDDFTQKLLKSLRHLNSQVSDMLAYAHLGEPEKSTMLVSELIQQINLYYASGSAQATLRLIDQTNACRLYVGKSVLVGAITNLIDNALQATQEPSSEVVCSFSVTGQRLIICVKDQGVGLSDHQKAHLLEPFFSTKTNGTGLGLAVVNEVVNSHGGRVSFQSTLGDGTSVEMSLPVVQIKPELNLQEV